MRNIEQRLMDAIYGKGAVKPARPKLAIREVLHAAYMGQAHHGRMHSHAVEVDDQGQVIRVLCGNVKPGSLADGGATDAGTKAPTCPRCLPKWLKLTKGA